MTNKKGFTLIELLVVVLIAGILAAIAIPQYFKAVERSRTTEVLGIIGSLAASLERARLSAAGNYPENLGDLDITFNDAQNQEVANGLEFSTSNFDITVDTASGIITAVRNNDGNTYHIIKNIRGGTVCCGGDANQCASVGLLACE